MHTISKPIVFAWEIYHKNFNARRPAWLGGRNDFLTLIKYISIYSFLYREKLTMFLTPHKEKLPA